MTAFEGAKPFKITCGSYHNVCLSYRLPKMEEPDASEENGLQVLGQRNQNNAAAAKGGAGGAVFGL